MRAHSTKERSCILMCSSHLIGVYLQLNCIYMYGELLELIGFNSKQRIIPYGWPLCLKVIGME